MESLDGYGLSTRGAENVAAIWPLIVNAVKEREKQYTAHSSIDMSTSENWLLRHELMQHYKQAIQNNLCGRHLSYPDGLNGDSGLLGALVQFINSHFSPFSQVEKEHVSIAPGAAFALDALLYNICEPGDGLLVPTPCWNGFDWLLNVRSSVKPVFVLIDNLDDVFTSKVITALEDTWSKSLVPIKGLLLTNPQNPLGQCYPTELITSIVRFCDERNIHFISDEIYGMSIFPNEDIPNPVPFVSILNIDIKGMGFDLSRVHMIWSTSKDLGSSGLRVGCCVTQANKPLATGIALASNTQTSSLAAIATAGLLNSPDLPQLFRLNAKRLSEAYLLLTAMLKKHSIQYIPANQTPFLFARLVPDARTWEEEAEFGQICKNAGVAISNGKSYHLPECEKGWARLNFAIEPASLIEALKRLDSVLTVSQDDQAKKEGNKAMAHEGAVLSASIVSETS
ncbi:PLP-dependent transferase [Xylaria cf. heliscus]|nr:PLP-dependent transferase [Xylaria cf. heliscus]